VEPAPELRDLLLRLYEAIVAAETDFLDDLVSREDGALLVGTDQTEWWLGYEQITSTWGAQLRELAGRRKLEPGNPVAFRSGDVGWVADEPHFEIAGGASGSLRLTAVFQRERGGWKLVQAHASFPVANEEVAGASTEA
jgi:ketosteroid isomerase-like protein